MTLDIWIATPAGTLGQGGIDRLMADVRRSLDGCDDGVRVRFVSTRGRRGIWSAPFVFAAALLDLVVARLLGRVDLVHINIASKGSTYRKLVLASLCRLLGVPYQLHLHGARYRQFYASTSPLIARWIRHMYRKAERVFVLGSVWADFIGKEMGVDPARLVTLPNATTRPQAAATVTDIPTILFLGRLDQRKGVDDLVAALGSLPDTGWRAVIAGDGDIDRVRGEIDARGLGNRIEVPGWVGSDDVARLLANAAILVLPSYDENLPISVIEGMAYGLGVVATPVGAVRDIIVDGETGLLVEPGDHAGLAAALGGLIEDPDLRRRLGENARRFHAEQLEIGAYTERLVRQWREGAR